MYLFVCDHTRKYCPKPKQQQHGIKCFQLHNISSYLSQNKEKNFSPLLLHSCLHTASSTVRVGRLFLQTFFSLDLCQSRTKPEHTRYATSLSLFLPPAGQMNLPANESLPSGSGALWSLQKFMSNWKNHTDIKLQCSAQKSIISMEYISSQEGRKLLLRHSNTACITAITGTCSKPVIRHI